MYLYKEETLKLEFLKIAWWNFFLFWLIWGSDRNTKKVSWSRFGHIFLSRGTTLDGCVIYHLPKDGLTCNGQFFLVMNFLGFYIPRLTIFKLKLPWSKLVDFNQIKIEKIDIYGIWSHQNWIGSRNPSTKKCYLFSTA